jgi:hypothetical protein
MLVPCLHGFVWSVRKTFARHVIWEVTAIRSGYIEDLDSLLEEGNVVVRAQEDLNRLPPGEARRSQTRDPRGFERTPGRLQAVEAAKGSVHKGEAIVGGLEEERVIIATEATVEGGESLGGELIVRMSTWVNVFLVGVVSRARCQCGRAYNDPGQTKTEVFQLVRCALVWSDEIAVETASAAGVAVGFHGPGGLAVKWTGRAGQHGPGDALGLVAVAIMAHESAVAHLRELR